MAVKRRDTGLERDSRWRKLFLANETHASVFIYIQRAGSHQLKTLRRREGLGSRARNRLAWVGVGNNEPT